MSLCSRWMKKVNDFQILLINQFLINIMFYSNFFRNMNYVNIFHSFGKQIKFNSEEIFDVKVKNPKK